MWKFNGVNWTWVAGDNFAEGSAVYGTKGIPSSANKPGSRKSASIEVDSLNNVWIFGGTAYGICPLHSRIIESGGYVNDLWKLDGQNFTWITGSNVPSAPGNWGLKGIPNMNNTPSSRESAASWIDPQNNIWIFGGQGYDSSDSGNFYLFGSCLYQVGLLNDLWKFNGVNWTWISGGNVKDTLPFGDQGVTNPAFYPGGRTSHALWGDILGNIWVFAGYGFGGMYGLFIDASKLILKHLRWTTFGNLMVKAGHGCQDPEMEEYGETTLPMEHQEHELEHVVFQIQKIPSGYSEEMDMHRAQVTNIAILFD